MSQGAHISLVFREMWDLTGLRLVSVQVVKGRPTVAPHISGKTSEIWGTRSSWQVKIHNAIARSRLDRHITYTSSPGIRVKKESLPHVVRVYYSRGPPPSPVPILIVFNPPPKIDP